jgi:hypothetical protein
MKVTALRTLAIVELDPTTRMSPIATIQVRIRIRKLSMT